MSHDDRRFRRMRSVVICALGAVALGAGATLYAQANSDFMAKITILEIMDSMVTPPAPGCS